MWRRFRVAPDLCKKPELFRVSPEFLHDKLYQLWTFKLETISRLESLAIIQLDSQIVEFSSEILAAMPMIASELFETPIKPSNPENSIQVLFTLPVAQ